jgi:prepilin-type N-terminal cleavage/methylation domain-containing protein
MALLGHRAEGASAVGFRRRRFRSRHRGFTLVELAVVVAVIALLLGSLLVPLTTQVEQRHVAQTDQQLEEIRQALIGYAMINGRLPRPANSVTDGTEKLSCTLPTPVQACTGYLPWVALGVSQTDAWGKIFRYSVSPEFASNAGFNLSTVAASPKTVVTRDTSGTQQLLANNIVAIVMSYGANNFGTTVDGTAIANSSATNTDEQNNDSEFNSCGWIANCTTFWGRPVATSTGAAGGEFDDHVVWVSANVLFNRMVTAGKLP